MSCTVQWRVNAEYSSKTTFFPKGSLEFHHVEGVRISVSFLCTIIGLFYVSGKLPTYPSPKPTLTLSSYLEQNVGLGEGYMGSFKKCKMIPIILGYRNPEGPVGILPSFHGDPLEKSLSESHLPKRE